MPLRFRTAAASGCALLQPRRWPALIRTWCSTPVCAPSSKQHAQALALSTWRAAEHRSKDNSATAELLLSNGSEQHLSFLFTSTAQAFLSSPMKMRQSTSARQEAHTALAALARAGSHAREKSAA